MWHWFCECFCLKCHINSRFFNNFYSMYVMWYKFTNRTLHRHSLRSVKFNLLVIVSLNSLAAMSVLFATMFPPQPKNQLKDRLYETLKCLKLAQISPAEPKVIFGFDLGLESDVSDIRFGYYSRRFGESRAKAIDSVVPSFCRYDANRVAIWIPSIYLIQIVTIKLQRREI